MKGLSNTPMSIEQWQCQNISQTQNAVTKIIFNSDCCVQIQLYWWLRAIFSGNINSFIKIGTIQTSRNILFRIEGKLIQEQRALSYWDDVDVVRRSSKRSPAGFSCFFTILYKNCLRQNHFFWHYRQCSPTAWNSCVLCIAWSRGSIRSKFRSTIYMKKPSDPSDLSMWFWVHRPQQHSFHHFCFFYCNFSCH